MLQVSDLELNRDVRCLFSALSFEASGGQLLHLQGDNGAGKSSLLLALAGILPPTQGDIHWRGQDVQQDLLAYQQQVCFLGHRTGVCQDLTVLQQLQLYGFSKAEAWAFLRAQGMAQQAWVLCAELSAGQKQRMALARVFHSKAAIYLLDEPMNALDQQGCIWFYQQLQEKLQEQSVVVMTSHMAVSSDLPQQTLVLPSVGQPVC